MTRGEHVHDPMTGYGVGPYCADCGVDLATPDEPDYSRDRHPKETCPYPDTHSQTDPLVHVWATPDPAEPGLAFPIGDAPWQRMVERIDAMPEGHDRTQARIDLNAMLIERNRGLRAALSDTARTEGLDARTVAYIRQRVAADPTLAWPGEIDDILDDAARLARSEDPS